MKLILSRIKSGEKCYYGTYDTSDMSEAKAFTYAVWKFGECGDAIVIERAEDGKKEKV